MPKLHITGEPAADALLSDNANALVIGMLLDQQVTMEKAFAGPAVIAERLGGGLDVARIAAMDPEDFVVLCSQRPAIHRFPRAMAGRIQELCRVLVDDFQGDAANLFASASTGEELLRSVEALPGFGAQKAKIFVALLGKQWNVTPDGWREASGDYGLEGYRSVADITDAESLRRVRETKRAAKAAAKPAAPGAPR